MDLLDRMHLLKAACISKREALTWLGLSDVPLTQKGANKFLLGAIIDYQIKADKAWSKAEWLAEQHFNGANDIWILILSYTPEDWFAFCKANSVHRFPKAYERIQRIGRVIEDKYLGDARSIWSGASGEEVRTRLIELRMGKQITNMVLGALFDTLLLKGPLDVKADLHVTRVLGRALLDKEIKPLQAIQYSRQIHPENPWLLDSKLYHVGMAFCKKTQPLCMVCSFESICLHRESIGGR